MFFKHLRTTEFSPTFEWVLTSQECAERINLPHEDHPKFVGKTELILEKVVEIAENIIGIKSPLKISRECLLFIHESIFYRNKSFFAGKWRKVNVRVGLHHPLTYQEVPNLMKKLESCYTIKTIDDLVDWYKDFETIHPFRDGNGRVGSVVVASYAHALHPDKGWLAPNQ